MRCAFVWLPLFFCLTLGANAQPRIAASVPHSDSVEALIFSSDSTWLATAGGTTINIWETKTGRILRTLAGHSDSIHTLSLSSDNRVLASTSRDKTVKLWDPRSGDLIATLSRSRTDSFYKLKLRQREHPQDTSVLDGGRSALVAVGSELVIFEIRTGKELRSFDISNNGEASPRRIVVSPDERKVFVGYYGTTTSGGRIARWDIETGRQDWTSVAHNKGDINSLSLSSDGKTLISAGGKDRSIAILDAMSGTKQQTLKGHTEEVMGVAVSPTGRQVASSSLDKTVRVWDIASGQIVWSNETSYGSRHVAISPNGAYVAAGSSEVTKLWSLDGGKVVKNLSGETMNVSYAASPDGSWLVSNLFLLDSMSTVDGRQAGDTFRSEEFVVNSPVRNVVKDPSGRWLIPAAARPGIDEKIGLLDLRSGEYVQGFNWEGNSGTPVATLSPDGRLFAVGSGIQNFTLNLFDIQSRRLLRAFDGSQISSINEVTFSSDGRAVAGANRQRGRLWDIASGRLMAEVKDDSRASKFLPDNSGVLKLTHSTGYDKRTMTLVDSRYYLTKMDLKGKPIWKAGLEPSLSPDRIFISADSRYAVTGGNSTQLQLWDAVAGKFLHNLQGSLGYAQTVLFLDENRKILAGNSNGTSSIWDARTGSLLATTVYGEPGAWVTITPEGFFVASPKGMGIVYVANGFETFGIEQVYQALYRPDLVREKLTGDRRGLVRKAAAEIDLARVADSGTPPTLNMAFPTDLTRLYPGSINATVDVVDGGGGIGRIEWRVNGVTTGIDELAVGATSPLRLSHGLQLERGENLIEVVAYNAANLLASPPLKMSLFGPRTPSSAEPVPPSGSPTVPSVALPSSPVLPMPPGKPRLFVLVAGINEYVDQRLKLTYAVPDAREIARGFQEASGNLYQSVEVKLMTDREVVKEELDAAFTYMARNVAATDVFVLYLAGHGKTVDGRYYFVPQDFLIHGQLSDESINAAVKKRAITQEQLQRWFASVPARKSVILFDTCDSGTLAGDETQELERTAASDRLVQATGRSIIAASGGSQEAIEGYRGHGLFTYQVLDAINRSDGDNSGTVDVNELAAYVYGQVSEISQKVFKQRQVPQMRITSNYPLAKPTRILMDEEIPTAEVKSTVQLAKTASLQVQPGSGATVIRSLNPKTNLTVLESRDGWSLVATEGRPLGYVATRDLSPAR